MRINLPNQITIGRLFLTVILLVLLGGFEGVQGEHQAWKLEACFWLFIIAALSDILDGYLARRNNQVTSFGRILDPFVDKLLVCGAFILLLGRGFHDAAGSPMTGLSSWMVVIIVGRELLVSGLRGFSEAKGTPYAANHWGKVKMLVQSLTVPLIIGTVGGWRGVGWIMSCREVMIYVTVGVTALSAIGYLYASREALSERSRG